jgi:hypothetical protein
VPGILLSSAIPVIGGLIIAALGVIVILIFTLAHILIAAFGGVIGSAIRGTA